MSTVKSPLIVKLLKVPTDVIPVCAAVVIGPAIEPNLPIAPDTAVDPEIIAKSTVPCKLEAFKVPSIVPNLPIAPETAVDPDTIDTTNGSGTELAATPVSFDPSP